MIGVMLIVLNLFRNQSIKFFGFNLILEDGANFSRASLSINWYFILTFLVIFTIVFLSDYLFTKLRRGKYDNVC